MKSTTVKDISILWRRECRLDIAHRMGSNSAVL
nr:MAG TPA: hypothetical protein [Caudoviricetes sp.]